MAYLFQQEESISSAIKRIALELLDYSLKELRDETNHRDEAIHEARKSFKQLRALLRLIRAETGEEFYQQHNQFYRDLAFQLAPLRDAFVLIESLDKLERGDTKQLRQSLMSEYETVRDKLLEKGGAVSQVMSELEAACPEIENWIIPGDTFKLIKAGLEASYQQGCKRLHSAYQEETVEEFHEWRKAVKSLWYHCRLLEASHPEMLKPYTAKLKKLSEILGEANDFAILEAYCAEHGHLRLIPGIQKKRQFLVDSAKALGKSLYKEEKAKFIKKIKAAWEKWQADAA